MRKIPAHIITLDYGLLSVAFREITGSKCHKLIMLSKIYEDACGGGQRSIATSCEDAIRKLIGEAILLKKAS